jgi:hypothetical protein
LSCRRTVAAAESEYAAALTCVTGGRHAAERYPPARYLPVPPDRRALIANASWIKHLCNAGGFAPEDLTPLLCGTRQVLGATCWYRAEDNRAGAGARACRAIAPLLRCIRPGRTLTPLTTAVRSIGASSPARPRDPSGRYSADLARRDPPIWPALFRG